MSAENRSNTEKIKMFEDLCKMTEEVYSTTGFISAYRNQIHLSMAEFFTLFGDTEYEFVDNENEMFPIRVVRKQDGYEFFCLCGEDSTIESLMKAKE